MVKGTGIFRVRGAIATGMMRLNTRTIDRHARATIVRNCVA